MTPLFAFLFSVPCLTALFMLTFQLVEEHIDNSKPQVPYEGFGRPTAKIQFSSFREIVATESALSPLQSWATAGTSASVTPLAASPVQPLPGSVRQPQLAKARAKRQGSVLAKPAALRTPETALPLALPVLPNRHVAAKPPAQPAVL